MFMGGFDVLMFPGFSYFGFFLRNGVDGMTANR